LFARAVKTAADGEEAYSVMMLHFAYASTRMMKPEGQADTCQTTLNILLQQPGPHTNDIQGK